ncbi:Aste57867_13106 [Aphanomyces stellatus]|uniref:Acyltransferase n=1 Tax=Aphanomyces stellatus TaxID=120398 RepID=A0A485KXZ4_9STRA|nr:hypothetical protein As57867_013058 [Aphanomyces stellatus]VFT89950.1 Aste57867_13106 [Aphanomyces stellatus]
MLGLWVLLSVWMGSMAFVTVGLVAFVLIPATRAYILVFVLVYYGTRPLIPLRRSQTAVAWFTHVNATHYFHKQALVREDPTPIPPASKTMLAYHPHGILCCGWSVHGAMHASWTSSNISWLVADVLFKLPFVSNAMSWGGCSSAAKRNFEGLMKQGENIALLPGGFQEATLYAKGEHRLFLHQRTGFIKYGLQYGYKVVPVYNFGEEHTYHAMSSFLGVRLWLNQFQLPGAVPFGTWWCAYMPLTSAELTTVVGKPIQLPHIENPTRDDVAKYHKIYVDALQDLFERNKAKYAADPKATLHVY